MWGMRKRIFPLTTRSTPAQLQCAGQLMSISRYHQHLSLSSIVVTIMQLRIKCFPKKKAQVPDQRNRSSSLPLPVGIRYESVPGRLNLRYDIWSDENPCCNVVLVSGDQHYAIDYSMQSLMGWIVAAHWPLWRAWCPHIAELVSSYNCSPPA